MLSNEEIRLIEKVSSSFKNVVVILDVGIMIDSSWFKNNPRISSVLFAGLGGMEGGLAIAPQKRLPHFYMPPSKTGIRTKSRASKV